MPEIFITFNRRLDFNLDGEWQSPATIAKLRKLNMNFEMTLRGTTPLLMHNPRMVDPNFEIQRELKKITSKRKKTDEDLKEIERLEWYGGLYAEDGVIFQPTSKPRKCIVEAGRTRKLGKSVERTVMFTQVNVPLIYDGPSDIDEIFKDEKYHSRLSVGVNGKRVMRVRPKFNEWAMQVDGVFIENAGMNFDDFVDLAELAGKIQGIGDNRVNGYGRFSVEINKA